MSRRDNNRDAAVGGGGVMILCEVASPIVSLSVELELTAFEGRRRRAARTRFFGAKSPPDLLCI